MQIQRLAHKMAGIIRGAKSLRRRKNRTKAVLSETLECRQLLTGSLPGIVTGGGLWAFDTNGGGAAEIDRRFGLPGDQFVAGRWEGNAAFGDLPAVARVRGDGFLHWYLNTDGSVTPQHEVDFLFGLAGDTAVAGDWNGDGRTDAGVVRRDPSGGLTWYLDLDRDAEPEVVQSFGLHGDIPVVGDWDNNGTANVGVVRTTASGFLEWHLDVTGDAWPEVSRIFGLAGDKPVVGDWNNDGRIDLGVARASQSHPGLYEWHRDINGDPLGDLPVITFGTVSSQPIAGRWRLSEVSVLVNVAANQIPVFNGQAGSDAVSFGKILEGGDSQLTFTVRNTGTRDLEMGPVSLPSGFSLVEPLTGRLGPGQQDQFTVRMDTSSVRELRGNISFLTNDGNESPFSFLITGSVEARRSEVELSGSGVFGNVTLNTTGYAQERTFVVTNAGNIPLTFHASSESSQFVIVSGASAVLAPGATGTIVVRMRTTSSGTKRGVLSLVTIASGFEHRVLTRELSGTVSASTGTAIISVSDNTQFGTISAGSMSGAEREFIVTNTGTAPYTFSATLSNTSFVFVAGRTGTVAANGGTARIVVRMLATTVGSKSAVLRLSSTLSRTLSGQVVAAQSTQPEAAVTIGATTLAPGQPGLMFYSAGASSVRTQTFVICNTGNGTLRVTNPVVTGEFTHDMPLDFSLLPGARRTITVVMRSTIAGTKIGRLTFTTNDSDEGVVRINLLGRKLEPVTLVQGNATSLLEGTYTIYHSGAEVVYIDPSYGRTPLNGAYAITLAGTKLTFTSSLRKVVIVSSVRPNVQNWTGVSVEWRHSSRTFTIPSIRYRLDLFQ